MKLLQLVKKYYLWIILSTIPLIVLCSFIAFNTVTSYVQASHPVYDPDPDEGETVEVKGISANKDQVSTGREIVSSDEEEEVIEQETEKITNTNEKPSNDPDPTPTPPPPDPTSCPQVTQNCVPCQCGTLYCRCLAGDEWGYKGWACQNNNPSNIRYSSYRIGIITSMGGPAPCGDRGGYMAFNTYSDGRNGVKAYLRGIAACKHSSYVFCGCGDCSLREFFTKYAPAGDQNDPTSYSIYMADRLGVDVDKTPLSWIVANKLEQMVDALQYKEGWFTQ